MREFGTSGYREFASRPARTATMSRGEVNTLRGIVYKLEILKGRTRDKAARAKIAEALETFWDIIEEFDNKEKQRA